MQGPLAWIQMHWHPQRVRRQLAVPCSHRRPPMVMFHQQLLHRLPELLARCVYLNVASVRPKMLSRPCTSFWKYVTPFKGRMCDLNNTTRHASI